MSVPRRNKPICVRKPTKASATGRILVLDDERRVADSIAFMLEHEGYAVKVACSGPEAIEIAKKFKPMLVLADLVMPEMNGVDAVREICRELPFCKVMFISGHAVGRQLCQEAQLQGHFDFIDKPTHPTEMLAKIRFALAL
jgi:DNA-binding response OmpR family regulator